MFKAVPPVSAPGARPNKGEQLSIPAGPTAFLLVVPFGFFGEKLLVSEVVRGIVASCVSSTPALQWNGSGRPSPVVEIAMGRLPNTWQRDDPSWD